MICDIFIFLLLICSVESWMSAQKYCKSIGGNLPVLRQWEYLYHINDIAKPWPVYIGMTQVNYISSSVVKYSGENKIERRM